MFDWINEESLTWAVLAAGGVQWAHTAGFIAALRSQARNAPAPERESPSICVLMSVKGTIGPLAENLRSVLQQDYPGPVEYVFVVPSRSDPAHQAIAAVLRACPGRKASLTCSDAVPVRCSEKILNLLHALRTLRPQAAVLVFADADVRVRPDWLRNLVAPLRDLGVVASVTHSVYVPHGPEPLQLLRLACCAFVASSMYLGRVVAGWSWAVRREDFEGLRIADIWSTRLADDVSLNAVFRRDGRRVAWAALAAPSFFDDCDLASLQRNCNKAYQYLKAYDFPVWTLMSLAVLGTAYFAYWALVGPVKWRLLALVLGMNMLNLFAIFEALRRFLPRQFDGLHPAFRAFPLLAALCAPAVLIVFLIAVLNSLVSRTVRWGGYVYRINAPDRIEVVG